MTKRCFFISPIGEEGSESRQRADETFNIVKKVCKDLGYAIDRADHISEPGNITQQIITRLTEDDLVIADLTGYNPNVFYELAVRHAINKPVIHLIEKPNKPPFDVANFRAIMYSMNPSNEVLEFIEQLESQIKSIENSTGPIESPISGVLKLQQLRHSADPEKQASAAILTTVQEVASRLSHLTSRIDSLTLAEGEGQRHYLYTSLINISRKLALLHKSSGSIDSSGFQGAAIELKNISKVLEFPKDDQDRLEREIEKITAPTLANLSLKTLEQVMGTEPKLPNFSLETLERIMGTEPKLPGRSVARDSQTEARAKETRTGEPTKPKAGAKDDLKKSKPSIHNQNRREPAKD